MNQGNCNLHRAGNNDDKSFWLLSGGYPDERKGGTIHISKFRHDAMTPPETEDCRDIHGNTDDSKSRALEIVPVFKRLKIKPFLNNPVRFFPATDILVLMSTAHIDQSALFERIECHGCGIMIAGEEITRLMG